MEAPDSHYAEDQVESHSRPQAHLEGYESAFLVKKLRQEDLVEQFAELLKADPHFPVDAVVDRVQPRLLARIVDQLVAGGAPVDPTRLFASLSAEYQVDNLAQFQRVGVPVDLEDLVRRLTRKQVEFFFPTLIEAGVPADLSRVVGTPQAYAWLIVPYYDELVSAGYDLNLTELVSSLSPWSIMANLDLIHRHGIPIDVPVLAESFDEWGLAVFAERLHKEGIAVDTTEVIKRLAADIRGNSNFLGRQAKSLLAAGADPAVLLFYLDPEDVAYNLSLLLGTGAVINVDDLVQSLSRPLVIRHYLTLRKAGASENALRRRAGVPLPRGRRHSPPRAAAPEPTAAVIRRWLRAHGHNIPTRGRIPGPLVELYEAQVKSGVILPRA